LAVDEREEGLPFSRHVAREEDVEDRPDVAAERLSGSRSAGLACWDGFESAEKLVGRADAALYAAKRAGRDCLVAA
jgi:GGDEF domain-containing protein